MSASSDIASAAYLLDSIPADLRQALRQPGGARVAARVLLGLAVAGDFDQEKLARDIARTLAEHGPRYRLPLLELATPALRRLPRQDRADFVADLRRAIEADGRVTLHEFVYYALISSELVSAAPSAVRMDANEAFATILGTAAHAFTVNARDAAAAFEAGASVAVIPPTLLARETLSIQRLEAAIACVRALGGPCRRLALDTITAVISRDGTISCAELEFVRAIGASIDCPVALPARGRR